MCLARGTSAKRPQRASPSTSGSSGASLGILRRQTWHDKFAHTFVVAPAGLPASGVARPHCPSGPSRTSLPRSAPRLGAALGVAWVAADDRRHVLARRVVPDDGASWQRFSSSSETRHPPTPFPPRVCRSAQRSARPLVAGVRRRLHAVIRQRPFPARAEPVEVPTDHPNARTSSSSTRTGRCTRMSRAARRPATAARCRRARAATTPEAAIAAPPGRSISRRRRVLAAGSLADFSTRAADCEPPAGGPWPTDYVLPQQPRSRRSANPLDTTSAAHASTWRACAPARARSPRQRRCSSCPPPPRRRWRSALPTSRRSGGASSSSPHHTLSVHPYLGSGSPASVARRRLAVRCSGPAAASASR